MLERMGGVDDVERIGRERELVHVHDEDVRSLREDVDAHNVLEATSAEAVQLEAVAAADAEDRPARRLSLRHAVDQRRGSDAGVVLALRERPLELGREVLAIFGWVPVPEPEPVQTVWYIY